MWTLYSKELILKKFKGKNFSLEGIGNLLKGEKPLEVTSDFMKMIEKNETFNK